MAWTDPSAKLEQVFRDILRDRMQGLPFINPALSVQAIGFRRWNGNDIGILLTPWFMNLMLLPSHAASGQWRRGSETTHGFPAGEFGFVIGEEPGVGLYQMCSLFSPVFDFPDQITAVAVAEEILDQLFREPQPAGMSRRQLLRGRFHGQETTPA
jgi:[NiFe] hydrogenase assembly HybE family chaperone